MTETILVDIQMSAVTLKGPSVEEVFFEFLEHLRVKESLPPFVKEDYKKIKRKLKMNLDSDLKLEQKFTPILSEFFGNSDKVIESAVRIVSLADDWLTNGTGKSMVDITVDYGEYGHKSLSKFGKVVYFMPTSNKIESVFYQLLFNRILPNNTVYNYHDSQFLDALEKADLQHLWVISARPGKLNKKLLGPLVSQNKFSFKDNFIYFASPDLDSKTMMYYDEQLTELGVIWDIFSLKILPSRMIILTMIKRKLLSQNDIILVQYFNLPEYIQRGIKLNIFQEAYPIVFSLTHPLSKRPMRFKRVVWYYNWMHLASEEQIVGFREIDDWISRQTFSSKPVFEMTPRDVIKYYGSRKLMQDKLNSISESASLRKRLDSTYPIADVLPIKTIVTGSKDANTVCL